MAPSAARAAAPGQERRTLTVAAALPVVLAALSAAVGIIVVAAWYLHWTAILRVGPGRGPVMFNSGLGLAITGTALTGLVLAGSSVTGATTVTGATKMGTAGTGPTATADPAPDPTSGTTSGTAPPRNHGDTRAGRGWRAALTVAAAYDVAVGAVSLAEYASGRSLWIDQAFVHVYLTAPGVPPGRDAPNAAICWTVLGVGLLSARWPPTRRLLLTEPAGAVVVALAVVALFGYAAGLPASYDWGHLTGMGMTTATGLALLGAAVMMLARPADPAFGFWSWWALPAGLIALAVDVFAWLAFAGGPDQELPARAIHATTFLGLLLAAAVTLVIGQNHRTQAIARALRQAEARDRRALLELRALTDNSPDFVVRYDRDCRRLFVNPSLARVYDLPPDQLVGRVLGAADDGSHTMEIQPASVRLMRTKIDEVFRLRTSPELEIHYRTADGLRTVHYRLVPEFGEDGEVVDVLAIGRDLTELKRIEQELEERESRYRAVFDNALDSMFLLEVSEDGQHFRNLEINPALEKSAGIPREQMIGRLIEETVPPETAELVNAKYRRCVQAGVPIEEEAALELPAGRRWYHSTLIPARSGDGRVYRIIGITRDVTDHRAAAQALADSEERFRLAFDDSLVGMAVLSVDAQERFPFLRVNPAMCEFLGQHWRNLLGHAQAEVLQAEDAGDVEKAFTELVAGSLSSYRAEQRFRHANGELVWGLLGATLVRDAAGTPLYLLSQVEDVTARKRAEEQLVFRALHDDLTGLPNRALLLEHLGNALARSRRTGSLVAVLFLDLDDFKSVNDSFGHTAGDELLARVAARISASVRASDVAARVGGDEFVVVCEDLADAEGAGAVADQLQRGLAGEVALAGHLVTTPVSMGIAISHEGSTPENLLRDADSAMYQAKHRGGRRWEPADASLHAAAMRVLSVEAELRRAVEREELLLHYQPIVDLGSERIVAVEALLRWQHPQRGLVLPGDFVDVAEQRGLIGQIGRWVLRTACRQAADWHRRHGERAPAVAVNVSSRQLGDKGVSADVHAALAESGLPPDRLSLEVTESQLLTVSASSTADLLSLAGDGVRIAVDDFGTGFAGFEYLRRLPVDELKIDKSFVEGVAEDRTRTAITAGVAALGVNLGLIVVAEGIETEVQRDALREMGCDWGQGFLWSAALPPDRIEPLLAGD